MFPGGAAGIRHFTSEMRVQVPGVPTTFSQQTAAQLFQHRHAKLISFTATLKSSFAIQWGA